MIQAQKYYASLQENIDDETARQIALERYFNEEYKNFMNDYIHVISTHSDHLETISEQLVTCNMEQCQMMKTYRTRHPQNDRKSHNNRDDQIRIELFVEQIETVHFWLYHQFDVGTRVIRDIEDYKDNQDEKVDGIGRFDAAFERMRTQILKKRQNSEQIRNNKYKLEINQADTKTSQIAGHSDAEISALDSFIQHLRQEAVGSNVINLFVQFQQQQEYDTDALRLDIIDYQNGSNILNLTQDQHFNNAVKEYAHNLATIHGLLYLFLLMLYQNINHIHTLQCHKKSVGHLVVVIHGFIGIGIIKRR